MHYLKFQFKGKAFTNSAPIDWGYSPELTPITGLVRGKFSEGNICGGHILSTDLPVLIEYLKGYEVYVCPSDIFND